MPVRCGHAASAHDVFKKGLNRFGIWAVIGTMRRFLRLLSCALAFVAMVHAQVFGIQRGYVYELDGERVETVAEHHHRGDDLNSGHFADYTPHHHDEGDEEDGTEHHAPLKVDLDAPQIQAAVSVPLAVDLATFEIPHFLYATGMGPGREIFVAPPPDTGGLSPRAALLVAQCMVMLV